MARVVEYPWVWVDEVWSVDALAGEDTGTVVVSEHSPAKIVVVDRRLEVIVASDDELVIGGNPKTEPEG